jgi:outer membrane protease
VKNIAVFCSFVILSLSPSPLSSETSAYTFSVSPLVGFLWGQGEEQLYRSATSDDLLSQLLWDIKPLWYVGSDLEFAQRKPAKGFGFFGRFTMKFGIPAETGIMEDRDWVTPWEGPELTNYSRHRNISDGTMILDLALGINIPLGSPFALRLSLGFSYLHFAWTSYDGYLQYGQRSGNHYLPIDNSSSIVQAAGPGISYSQDWTLLPLGLAVDILPGALFSGSLWFYAGPMLRFYGLDNHLLRINTADPGQFLDVISGGYTLEPGGEFRFAPHERFSLALSFSRRSITARPHGASYSERIGYPISPNLLFDSNTAGA